MITEEWLLAKGFEKWRHHSVVYTLKVGCTYVNYHPNINKLTISSFERGYTKKWLYISLRTDSQEKIEMALKLANL